MRGRSSSKGERRRKTGNWSRRGRSSKRKDRKGKTRRRKRRRNRSRKIQTKSSRDSRGISSSVIGIRGGGEKGEESSKFALRKSQIRTRGRGQGSRGRRGNSSSKERMSKKVSEGKRIRRGAKSQICGGAEGRRLADHIENRRRRSRVIRNRSRRPGQKRRGRGRDERTILFHKNEAEEIDTIVRKSFQILTPVILLNVLW